MQQKSNDPTHFEALVAVMVSKFNPLIHNLLDQLQKNSTYVN